MVVLVLIGLSVYSWATFFKKKKEFKIMNMSNDKFNEVYGHAGNFNEIIKETEKYEDSSLRFVFIKGHTELIKIGQKTGGQNVKEVLSKYFEEHGTDIIERALDQGISEMSRKLSRNLDFLATISSISPYIGLFGTVWGIINSFRGLSSGSSSLDAVAPGIAEALFVTALGLFVAISAVFFLNYLSSRLNDLKEELYDFENDFLNMISRSIITKSH